MLDPGVVTSLHTARTRPQRRPGRKPAAWLGPAVVVSVAYVDPGNFATNSAAGAELGTRLLWVVAAASVAAMLVQYLAAKLGAVTRRSLPELSREEYPRPVTWLLWLQAELVIMATDLAEVLGGAIALHLLFGLPLPVGGVVVATASMLLLGLEPERRRRFHVLIGFMLVCILAAFVYQAASVGIGAADTAAGMVPSLGDDRALLLATGIIGATVMPHAIYVHSGLSRAESTPSGTDLRWHRRDIVLMLGAAASVNMLILLIAAATLHGASVGAGDLSLGDVHRSLSAVGPAVGAAFAVALLLSGLASTAVGTSAGDTVMTGYLRRRIPAVARRMLTLAAPLAVVATGFDPTAALVLSQVLLSMGVPFALVPLLHLTSSRRIMGDAVNKPWCTAAACAIAVVISSLNAVLVWQAI